MYPSFKHFQIPFVPLVESSERTAQIKTKQNETNKKKNPSKMDFNALTCYLQLPLHPCLQGPQIGKLMHKEQVSVSSIKLKSQSSPSAKLVLGMSFNFSISLVICSVHIIHLQSKHQIWLSCFLGCRCGTAERAQKLDDLYFNQYWIACFGLNLGPGTYFNEFSIDFTSILEEEFYLHFSGQTLSSVSVNVKQDDAFRAYDEDKIT